MTKKIPATRLDELPRSSIPRMAKYFETEDLGLKLGISVSSASNVIYTVAVKT